MLWIKRNLFFVLSAGVGVLLMLGAGYFLYSGMTANSAAGEELKQANAELDTIQKKTPYPSKENIQAAKDAQQQVREIVAKFNTSLPPFQNPPKMDDRQFKELLDKTIAQLRAGATNNGVGLLPDYGFSFAAITSKLNFPTEAIPVWAVQLQDMKAICDVLYAARVNFLEGIRRVPVSADELVASSALDFLVSANVTNETSVRAPYEIAIRAYSAELAATINGLMRSSNYFLIKNIDVAPTASLVGSADPTAAAQAQPSYGGGRRRSRGPAPVVTAQQNTPDPSLVQTGPVTIASEGLLRAVILVEIVKAKPVEVAPAKAAKAADAAAPADAAPKAPDAAGGRRSRGANAPEASQ